MFSKEINFLSGKPVYKLYIPFMSFDFSQHYCHGSLTKPKSGQKLGHNAKLFIHSFQTSQISVVFRKAGESSCSFDELFNLQQTLECITEDIL